MGLTWIPVAVNFVYSKRYCMHGFVAAHDAASATDVATAGAA